jgi:SAM-dependent methyltransferase
MNRIHHWYCRSATWKRRVESELMPWALGGATLEGPALQIGRGPGFTTNYLRTRVSALTALEKDHNLAKKLAARFRNTSVQIIEGDATAMPFETGAFRTVFSFTMLHHVPSPSLQDRVLAEARLILAPGGTFLGTDSRMSLRMKLFHCFDTMVIVDPATLPQRLRRAGFANEQIELSDGAFRFRATRSQKLY